MHIKTPSFAVKLAPIVSRSSTEAHSARQAARRTQCYFAVALSVAFASSRRRIVLSSAILCMCMNVREGLPQQRQTVDSNQKDEEPIRAKSRDRSCMRR
jgi:hypothetical protein